VEAGRGGWCIAVKFLASLLTLFSIFSVKLSNSAAKLRESFPRKTLPDRWNTWGIFMARGKTPPPLWIWSAYLIHVERVGDQNLFCTNQSMLSINQSYFMIFSLLNQSLKAIFFQIKYSILARSIYSQWVERVGNSLKLWGFPHIVATLFLFICKNTASASDILGGCVYVVFTSF
jgi:hypothetical protein